MPGRHSGAPRFGGHVCNSNPSEYSHQHVMDPSINALSNCNEQVKWSQMTNDK